MCFQCETPSITFYKPISGWVAGECAHVKISVGQSVATCGTVGTVKTNLSGAASRRLCTSVWRRKNYLKSTNTHTKTRMCMQRLYETHTKPWYTLVPHLYSLKHSYYPTSCFLSTYKRMGWHNRQAGSQSETREKKSSIYLLPAVLLIILKNKVGQRTKGWQVKEGGMLWCPRSLRKLIQMFHTTNAANLRKTQAYCTRYKVSIHARH